MTSLPILLFFSLALATLVAIWFLLLTRRKSENTSEMATEKILEQLEAKSRGSIIFWMVENLLEPIRETRRLTRDFNPRSIIVFLRGAHLHLKPNWRCEACGIQVMKNFQPQVDCSYDPLGEEWLARARVFCLKCRPILRDIEEVNA